MARNTVPGGAALIPYIRQSRKKEQTISLEDQRDAITKWATEHGVTLAAEVVEQGVSGSKSWRERELGAAIAAVQDGRAAGIVVAFQDRLSREQSLGTAEVWKALEDAGARFVAAAEGIDTAHANGNPDVEMLFSIKAAVARHQWKRHQKNWENAVARAVESGRYVGPCPAGYDRVDGLVHGEAKDRLGAKDGRLVKNTHAPVIAEAFHIRANGGSWVEIARHLTNSGVPTTTGIERWAISNVRTMMSNPIYKGELRNGHVHHFPEYVIVPPSLFDKVNPVPVRGKRGVRGPRWTFHYDLQKGIVRTEVKRERAAGTGKGGRQDGGEWAVLGGIIFCGNCGKRMTPRWAHGSYRYYVCQNKPACTSRATVNAAQVEPLVRSAAFDYLAEWYAIEGIGRDADDEKLGQLELQRDDAARRFEAWEASSDPLDPGYAEKKAALRESIQAAERAIAEEREAMRKFPEPDELRAVMETGTVREQRQLLRRAVERVVVWKKGTEPPVEAHALAETLRGVNDPAEGSLAALAQADPGVADRVQVEWRTMAAA